MVKKEELWFDSRDGETRIHALRWVPEGKVIGILQIIHGMAEHMERYDCFARFLAQKGILVTGEDHLGHGKSVPEGGAYGYFCEQDPATVVVRDVHRLKKMTQEDYPGIPYVILGHSMGSYMLRDYLCRYGTGIQGAVICATGSESALLVRIGKALAAVQSAFLGSKHVAKMINRIAFGSYCRRITDPATDMDWLSTDDKCVQDYKKDELCGFTFTVNGFRTMLELMDRLFKRENLQNMPKELPVHFIYGDEDPVGSYGVGVKTVYEDFRRMGMERVSMKMYAGCRHELLNEKIKDQVYEDCYEWILERVKEYSTL